MKKTKKRPIIDVRGILNRAASRSFGMLYSVKFFQTRHTPSTPYAAYIFKR